MVSAVRDGVHVAVSVTDQGRGIPAEQLPDLFRKFSRGQGADTPDGPAPGIDGPGLGLAICKGIVEAHGGRIRAESDDPGLGAPPAPRPAGQRVEQSWWSTTTP